MLLLVLAWRFLRCRCVAAGRVLQRPGRGRWGRCVVSRVRPAAQPDHRKRCHNLELGVSDRQCPATEAPGTVMSIGVGLATAPLARPFNVAYTRNVVSWAHRLTSLAVALALSGSPAVLAACMALCVESPVTAAAQTSQAHAGHGAHSAAAAVPAASSHAHHGAAATQSAGAVSHSSTNHESSDTRLVATCSNCCVDGEVASTAGLNAERSGANALGAAPSVEVASFHLPPAAHALSPSSPPTAPPAPTRAPLALRI